MTVIVAHPSLARRAAEDCRYWVYADDDQDVHARIAADIERHCAPVITAEAFQLKVVAARADFVAWSDRCRSGTPVLHWLTTPLFPNPHDNPLFLHYCWLTALRDCLDGGGRNLLVVTASSGMAAAVRSLCGARGLSCRVEGRARWRVARTRRTLRAAVRLCGSASSLLWRMLLARLILGSAGARDLRGIELIVDTYVLQGDLAPDGTFHDRYFPGLMDHYQRRGIAAAYRPVLFRIAAAAAPSTFRRMRSSSTRFIPLELFCSVTDVAWALWKSVAAGARTVPLLVAPTLSIDLRPIVEWHQPSTAMRAFLALVLTQFPKRIEAAQIRPRYFLEWYENHPIDKATRIGFGALASACEVVAVRQFPAAPGFLSLYTTTEEVKAAVAPRESWVCGRAQLQGMAIYDSAGTYRVVPALRYAHLHRTAAAPRPGTRLLVLLSYGQAESRMVLESLFAVLPETAQFFESVVIKPHPTVTCAAARRDAAHLSARGDSTPEWSDAPLASLLPDARIILSAHSSAALEAICAGKPVVVIGPRAGLAINALEEVDGRLWRLVYDPAALRAALELWSPEHPLPFELRVGLGQRIRDAFFEPADDTTMNAFIPRLTAQA